VIWSSISEFRIILVDANLDSALTSQSTSQPSPPTLPSVCICSGN
jgi:hypothetical protein